MSDAQTRLLRVLAGLRLPERWAAIFATLTPRSDPPSNAMSLGGVEKVGALNNGTVTVIGGGACLEAANASDVNGTILDPGGDCTANDPKELLTLG